MKDISEVNENITTNDKFIDKNRVTDHLLNSKGGHSLENKNNKLIDQSNELINGIDSMGHKSRCSQRNLLKTQESRSQSLPNSLDIKNQTNGYISDSETRLKLLPETDSSLESPVESPTTDLWFKTWPERNKNIDSEDTVSNNTSKCDLHSEQKCTNNKVQNTFTFNEALQSISLAYSPVTKQLHYLDKKNDLDNVESQSLPPEDVSATKPKLGHRRTEAGSFSSTVSSLSDPSPSGSLLDADERTSSPESDLKSKRKGFSSFFNR